MNRLLPTLPVPQMRVLLKLWGLISWNKGCASLPGPAYRDSEARTVSVTDEAQTQEARLSVPDTQEVILETALALRPNSRGT